jgi:hypothetical protein
MFVIVQSPVRRSRCIAWRASEPPNAAENGSDPQLREPIERSDCRSWRHLEDRTWLDGNWIEYHVSYLPNCS